MGADVRIAPMALEHVAGFRACLDAVAREGKFLAMTEAPPVESVRSFIQGTVGQDAAQFVALDGERVVGWADVLPSWGQAVAHCGRLGMGVLPEYRGRGIGRRLLLACVAKAQARGATRIELDVRADNAPAIRLYESAGFTLEARKRRAMRFGGVYHDALQMSLLSDHEA